MSGYWSRQSQLSLLTEKLQTLCSIYVFHQTATELQHQMEDIILMNDLIRKEWHMAEIQKSVNLQELHKSWSKRGAIDVLGNIASDMIGILDNRYAAHIENIRHMPRNEKEELNLINQHTTIIEQTA